MTDEDTILAVNQAFYQAFANGDIQAMERLWSDEIPIVCIHPGWNALSGRREVLQSWAGIFANPAAPNIRCFEAQVFQQGDTAFVVCYEDVQGSCLVATNIFVREAAGWKMIHHQAGQTAHQPTVPENNAPQTLH